MYEYLRAAIADFRAAQESEAAVGRAQRKVIEQRILTGELAAGPRRGGPGVNFATVLPERDPLLRELVRWTGPAEQPRQRQIITTSEPPAGARAAVQTRPW